jgi:2-(1,2-epoxy-1,2-dihydrophenyl)acetyl-CoA isomerase
VAEENSRRALDTGTEDLLCHVEDRAAVVTLNRPDAKNALSLPLKEQLVELLTRLAGDDEVGAVLLTGAGSIFSAGGDTGKMAEGDAISNLEDRVRRVRNEHRIPALLHEMPKPTICALPGAAAGAGLSIALACDLRIAAERAFVITSFSRLGLSGDYGGSWFLTQLVGPAKARELYFCSPRVASEECLRLGIFNRVVPDAELPQQALALARELAAGPPVAFRFMKQNLNRALTEDLQTCLDYEADRMVRAAFTDDFSEAVQAFQEKRTPRFKGR